MLIYLYKGFCSGAGGWGSVWSFYPPGLKNTQKHVLFETTGLQNTQKHVLSDASGAFISQSSKTRKNTCISTQGPVLCARGPVLCLPGPVLCPQGSVLCSRALFGALRALFCLPSAGFRTPGRFLCNKSSVPTRKHLRRLLKEAVRENCLGITAL